ncbi:MAG: rhomboid family intramembrane serine protease [Pseudomonadota bacterium]|nr:rhomboid family intramembrane serine protease [Pseudomonadota bacterium]
MVIIHRSLRMQECANRALVLQAMEIDHAVERDVLVWRVLVPEHEEARAREQLQLYEAENQAARSTIKHMPPQPGAVIGAVIWAYVLLTVFALQGRYGFGFDWVAAGRVDVAAIREGEWWRAVTALTLHGDAAHLFVNIGMGAVFGGLLAREVGVGLAWLLILIGGTVGNLMNVLVQRPWHTAIGASTAVFAALGLLAAYLWTGKRLIRDSWARRWAPVVGAVLLLAWLGTGGERTDIVAHLTGFLAGFGMGVVLGRVAQQGTAKPMRQWLLGGVSLLSVMLAWKFAL